MWSRVQGRRTSERHAPSPFDDIPHGKKRAFLSAYSLFGVKSMAAEAAGIDGTTTYTWDWMEDQQFQGPMERARQVAFSPAGKHPNGT